MAEIEREMPKYQCHKVVHALKIEEAHDPSDPGEESDGSMLLFFSEPGFAPRRVSKRIADMARPHRFDGYFVVYEDGYESFSPTEAFEKGYTRIE